MGKYNTNDEIAGRIRVYLFENFLFGYSDDELENNASFLELGILDSTGIMELVAFIEREFSIDVLDNEIIPDNLDSIDCISNFILKKTNAEN